jgi:hypothetical protein
MCVGAQKCNMVYNTTEEIDREAINVMREIGIYTGHEAAFKTTTFTKIRSKMAGAGQHDAIPVAHKERVMEVIGEPITKWPTFEAEYRNMFKKNKPGTAEYVGQTNPGERTVVRMEPMLYRASAKHTLGAKPGIAKDVGDLITSAVAIAERGLKASTVNSTRRKKFNSPESKKLIGVVALGALKGRKRTPNGERKTREEGR